MDGLWNDSWMVHGMIYEWFITCFMDCLLHGLWMVCGMVNGSFMDGLWMIYGWFMMIYDGLGYGYGLLIWKTHL